MKRKGFTLVELLIVIVVFSILSIVLFRTYNTIMRLSVRSEFQKNIQTDVLFVNQVMHSLADEYTINFQAYQTSKDSIDANGLVDTLHLVKKHNPEETATLSYDTEHCYGGSLDQERLIEVLDNDYSCSILYSVNNGPATALTSEQTLVTHVKRQLIPYQDNLSILTQASGGSSYTKGEQAYEAIAYPGVVMYWRAYHRGYGHRGATNVSQVIQSFFSLSDDAQL